MRHWTWQPGVYVSPAEAMQKLREKATEPVQDAAVDKVEPRVYVPDGAGRMVPKKEPEA